jgi:tRNA G10  N-methylase Trm11
LPHETIMMPPAARLVTFARVGAGQHLLDVACGTGVVAITARRLGARAIGLDFTAKLLERALQNSQIAGVDVRWVGGDVENLPFDDQVFDVVLSPSRSVAVVAAMGKSGGAGGTRQEEEIEGGVHRPAN